MFALFKKEINAYFSNITGYIVIMLFLLATNLFMWVFPGEMNILDGGYANIDTLFVVGPFIFMFLIPAVSMRMFAEEKKNGTIELLFTRPITESTVIAAKYLAGITIIIFALLPTLFSFISVYYLGALMGNIDTGGTWGSYIGLLLLALLYMAIGLFASSVTDSQIFAFLISLVIIFFFYLGFDYISPLLYYGNLKSLAINAGISVHYRSLSRGVIDSRDVFYFGGVILTFLLFTRIVLLSRKW